MNQEYVYSLYIYIYALCDFQIYIYIYTLYIYIWYRNWIVSKNSLKRNLVFLNHLTIICHAQLLRFWSFFVVFSFRKDPLGYVLLNTGWLISRDPYYGLLQSPNSWVVYIVPLYTLNNQGLFFHWSIGSFEYVTITVIIRNRNPKFMSESISMRQKKDDKPTCLKPPMVNFGHFGGELPNIESIQSVVTVVLSAKFEFAQKEAGRLLRRFFWHVHTYFHDYSWKCSCNITQMVHIFLQDAEKQIT